MYVVFIIVSLVSGGSIIGFGQSKQSFDLVATCEAARQSIVDLANVELAPKGMKVFSSECLSVEDAQEKVKKLLEDAQEKAKKL